MVRDEVCDTYLPQEDAVRANVGGVDYFFCSRECRDKFIEQKRNNRPDAV
jgi:YHS domain-containing protein